MRRHDGRGIRLVLVVAGSLVLLVLWSWGAAIGPDGLLTDGAPERGAPVGTGPLAPSGDSDQEPGSSAPSFSPPTGTSTPGVLRAAPWLMLGAGCAGLFFMVAVLRRMLPDRLRSFVRERDDTSFVSLSGDDGPTVEQLVAAQAEAQTERLLVGSPREAILACWEAFEQTTARAGAPRQAWETSSELVVRLLRRDIKDASAVLSLARLYREARFSDHPVPEETRDEAVALLRRIHDSMSATGPGGSG